MKTLILSANAGQGHNSCANAIREAFEAHGDFCAVEDVFGLISQRLSESTNPNNPMQATVFLYSIQSFLPRRSSSIR